MEEGRGEGGAFFPSVAHGAGARSGGDLLDTIADVPRRGKSIFREHALTLIAAAVLAVWTVSYVFSDPRTHTGAFFGNAIADWSGVVVIVFGTKFLYEQGSAESKPVPRHLHGKLKRLLVDHSFTLFLVVTGVGWLVAFARMEPSSKWGQVVGNILSEWVQCLGVVLLTKRFFEVGSAESRRR